MNRFVLVSGGAGFIGSHLVEELIERGYRVRVLDNLSQGNRDWVPRQAEFCLGDVTNLKDAVDAARGVDGIFHLAAMSRVQPSLDDVSGCTNPNVIGTQNVLMAARQAGVRRFLYAGSSTFYGRQDAPHRESMRPDFLNFYALTKYVGEEYSMLFDHSFGLSTAVVRYFNVYGPRQPETGAYALVIGIFLKRFALGLPLTIHGDGRQRRDFVHVRDVADATIRVFESNARAEVFNIGSGTNYSVKEIADMISPLQEHGPRRPGDAEDTLADVSRMRNLGWKARIAFEEGLGEMIDAVRSRVAVA
jgi:nucleoside-diphosphate-sugar epimerase